MSQRHFFDMNRQAKSAVVTLMLSVIVAEIGVSIAGEAAPERPKLYDTSADGKKQVAAALKTAKAGDKRVLLKFGANW